MFKECDTVTGEYCSPDPLDVPGIDAAVTAVGAGDFYSVALGADEASGPGATICTVNSATERSTRTPRRNA